MKLLALVALALVFAQGAAAASIRDYVAAINAARVAHGLRPLRSAPNARYAAAAHGNVIARHGYFSHALWTRRGPVPFPRWIRRYVKRNCTVGENLAWTSWNATPTQIVAMWMRSPEHRANLLRRSYRHVGFALTRGPDAYYQTLILESC